MLKQFIKWLDTSLFPVKTVEEYEAETLAHAKLELSKALDALLYTQALVTYRGAQVERLTNKTKPTDSAAVALTAGPR